MIIQEKSRNTEPRPFLSLSKKAFFFWCTFITGLFALFFFAGTLVGRGQIKVDLGQHALFQEINGVPQTPEMETETVGGAPETPSEDSTEFGFYDGLSTNAPNKEMEVTPTPSNKKKTKQVVKKNLDIVKPDELDNADVSSTEPPSEQTRTIRETKEKSKAEAVTLTPSEKSKTDTAQKTKTVTEERPKKETADKSKTESPAKVKPETADKTKTDTAAKAKSDAAEKTKKETASKEKAAGADTIKKPAEKTKTADKDTGSPKKYSLQVAALRNAADAEAMVKKLGGLGFAAHTVKSGDSVPWYKVRVGSFKDRADAENTMAKLKNKKIDSFVIAQ